MKTRTRSAPIGDQEAISREPVSSDQQFAARPEVAQALSIVSALEQQYVTYQVKTVEQYTASADDLKAIKRAQDAVQAEADKIVEACLCHLQGRARLLPEAAGTSGSDRGAHQGRPAQLPGRAAPYPGQAPGRSRGGRTQGA